jgi:hypothetical protein
MHTTNEQICFNQLVYAKNVLSKVPKQRSITRCRQVYAQQHKYSNTIPLQLIFFCKGSKRTARYKGLHGVKLPCWRKEVKSAMAVKCESFYPQTQQQRPNRGWGRGISPKCTHSRLEASRPAAKHRLRAESAAASQQGQLLSSP